MKAVARLTFAALGTLMAVTACGPRAPGLSATRSASLPAAGARVLMVDAGSGFLRVLGVNRSGAVQVDGIARASTPDMLRRVEFVARREGDTIRVSCMIPSTPRGSGDAQASLDLILKVPSDLRLEVVDSSGEAYFRNVGALRLVHAAGSLQIDTVAGDVAISNGSGDIVLDHVSGNVQMSDGSGSVRFYNIRGSVTMPNAGSGSVQLFDVAGNVTIGSKESGEVLANGVGGRLYMTAIGDGSIEYRNVKGRVDLGLH